jgi:outer membrane protein assembly factor BamB
MTIQPTNASSLRKPLRLWPGVVLVCLQWFFFQGLGKLFPDKMIFEMPAQFFGILAAVACGLLILLWWLLFSRAPWGERIGAIVLMVLGVIVTKYFAHESIRGGAMGMLLYILIVPVLGLAFVAWAVLTRNLHNRARRVTMVLFILLACSVFLLIRTYGLSGEGQSDFAWRWSKSHEEQLVAQGEEKMEAPPLSTTPAEPPQVQTQTAPEPTQSAPAAATPTEETTAQVEEPEAEWPGFRGPNRDGVAHGVRISTNWSATPPKELWRHSIGPGWSSFAVRGNLIYTQEQRGEDEIVSCYKLTNGKPVWKHRDAARFYESNAGPGPRGTPTIDKGRVYTLGATGIVNVLNANDGKVIWSRNAQTDTKAEIPGWGFSASPLVVDDVVVIATGGDIVAYDRETGNPRWYGPDDKDGYSSPHLVKVNGTSQVVFMNVSGVTSYEPSTGKTLWKHTLPKGVRITQPAVASDKDLLVNDGGSNIRRIALNNGGSGWTVKEEWVSIGLKPYFNDFVVHNGHAYGFDGNFISCINLEDGARKWKGGRYGSGQLILLADQGLLVVLAEKGDLALVEAKPEKFTELGRVPGIKGKTWNHPAMAGNMLLVRNAEEMAAFQLPTEE